MAITRYAKDYRGDLFPHDNGPFVFHRDYEIEMYKVQKAHSEEVSGLKDRIIALLTSIHGEFCATDMDKCACGREIRELKGELQ